jgi:predicted permease
MDTLWNDIKYALRSMRNNPGFFVVAVLTLALGIGANAAIFTVAKKVILDPLPFPNSERLMTIEESNIEAGLPRFSVAPPNFKDFHDRNKTFESMAAWGGQSLILTAAGREPKRLEGARVTGEFFEVHGMTAVLGRVLTPEDDRPEAEKVVLLNYNLWHRDFGGASDILGQGLILDGEPYTVVGVAAKGFQERRDFFIPLALDYVNANRGGHQLRVRGLLKPGVTPERAAEDLVAIAAALAETYPDTNTGWSALVVPLLDRVVEGFDTVVWMLLAAVVFVLLIACTNVANLLLARMASREKEVALRSALGAGRGRLITQFITESVILALLGGILGVFLAARGTAVLVAMNADSIPRSQEITVDLGVLLFTFLLAVTTGVVFGLLPALQASRPDLAGTLKEGGRGQAGGVRGRRIRNGLVLVEVALSVVLLVGAGLLLRSFERLLNVDPGFQPQGALTAALDLPRGKYPGPPEQAAYYRRLFNRLESLPGLEHVGGVVPMPLMGGGFVLTFHIEGAPLPEPNKQTHSNIRIVSDDYFAAMEIPLVQGRAFRRADDLEAPQIALVNQSFVEKFLPGEDPINKRVTFGDPASEDIEWLTIVGVVGDVHHESLATETDPELYWPYSQRPASRMTLVLQTHGDPLELVGPLRAAVQEIDPDLPVFRVRLLEEIVDESLNQPRFNSLLLGLFAGLALLLAAIGVYGVVNYSVSQQKREIGVRLALGAGRKRVIALVLKSALAVVLLGIVLGLLGAFFAAQVLQSMVYDVSIRDPATFGKVAGLLILVRLCATILPALRATRVDPAVVLRDE